MTYLDRVVLRELARSPGRTALLVIALAVAFMMPAGVEMGLRSLLATRTAFAERLGLADLEVRLLPEDISNLPAWDIPGVEAVESRLLMPGTITRDGKIVNALFVFLPDADPTVNRLELRAGRALAQGAEDEALLERSAIEYLGFERGETVAVQVGKKEFRQKIVGVVASPEFLMVATNPEYFLAEKGSLAILYTRLARMYEELGFVMVNDLVFRFAKGADREAVRRAILDRLGSRTIERVIARDDHLSWKHIAIDADIFGLFRPAISLVLALLAAALVVVTFDGLVRRTRRELGTLKAMGYSGRAITRSYVIAGLALGVLGAALGALGSVGFRRAFLSVYAEAHGLAYLEQHAYLDVLLKSLLWILVLSTGSAFLATWTARRASPIELLRPVVAAHGESHGRMVRALLRVPFSVRLGVRNVIRSPRLTGVTVCGVALTVSVGLSYLICLDSMRNAMVESFANQRWDRAASFAYPVLDEDYQTLVEGFPGAELEPYVRARGTLAGPKETQDISILGLVTQNSLRGVSLKEGRLARGPGEVVIGSDVVRRIGAGLGEELVLSVRHRDYAVRVVGVKNDVLLGEIVMPISELRRIAELEDQASGVFVRLDDEARLTTLDASMLRNDFVAKLTRRDSLVDKFMEILRDIRKLVILVASIAMFVGVIFIGANLSMTMQERATELSTLWALGCARSVALRAVFVEVLLQTTLALLLAAPATWLLATVLNGLASEAWFEQPSFFSPTIIGLVALGVIGLTSVAGTVTFYLFWRSGLLDNLRARAMQ